MNDLPSKFIEAGIQYVSSGKNVGGEDINIRCPYCDFLDPSAHCGINVTSGFFHCFRCGEGGGWRKLGKKLGIRLDDVFGGGDDFDIPLAQKLDPVDREEDFYREVKETDSKLFRFLLEERELDLDRCLDIGLKKGINGFKGYAVFCDGNAAVGRNYLDDERIKWRKPKGWKQRLFGAELVQQRAPEVGVIVEGIFDMVRFPVGTCAALLSKKISGDTANEILVSFGPSCKKLVLATDRDLASREKSDLVAKLKGLFFDVVVPDWSQVDPDVKDVDEFFVRYGEEEMYKFLGIPPQEEVLSFLQ